VSSDDRLAHVRPAIAVAVQSSGLRHRAISAGEKGDNRPGRGEGGAAGKSARLGSPPEILHLIKEGGESPRPPDDPPSFTSRPGPSNRKLDRRGGRTPISDRYGRRLRSALDTATPATAAV